MIVNPVRSLFAGALLLALASGIAYSQQPKTLPAQITKEAVAQVKQATVYLKVTTEGGQVMEGSGFLAGGSGVVITNAHVVGMLAANSKAPTKIEIVLHNGEANELKTTGQVLGVDRSADLAVLRVEGKLPAPLPIEVKDEPFETQKVYIFGFPLGAQLGKNITVSESSVSSLRKDPSGALEKIQVNGGMHPGNSGGPVVDSLGRVVGVSVSVIRSTQINFAIPSATVQSLLEGRIQDVKTGELFRQAQEVRLPLECSCLDPFQRVRSVRVEVWAGKPAASRPFSAKQAQPQPGDGPRQSQALKYLKETGSAEVVLPKVAEGQVAWVQPVMVLAKEEIWGAPRSFDPALALDLVPGDLTFKLAEQKERTVHLKAAQAMTLSRGKEKLVIAQMAELDILESFGPDAKGALVRMGFGVPSLLVAEDEKQKKAPPEVATLLQRIPPSFVIDETNRLRSRVNINLNPKLSPLVREQVNDYLMSVCNAYEAANFTMPNRQLKPRDPWEVQVPMMLKIGAKPEVLDLAMTCTYEGTRTRLGNQEALISFDGRVKGRNALKDKVDGQIAGKFTFDSKRGFISTVKMTISTDASSPGSELQAVYSFDVDLARVEGNPRTLELPKSPTTVAKKDDPKVDPKKVDPKVEVTPKATAFVKPAKSDAATSYMKVVSSPGDFIGQGKNCDYKGDQLVIKPTPRGVQITVDGWNLQIGAPRNQTLKVGEYPNAKRFAFSGESPGLDFFGKGRGSNQLTGEFVVWEMEVNGNQVVKLAIDFVQRSDGKPPLTGKIRFNSGLE